MAIRSEIVVTDNGSLVFEGYAKRSNNALDAVNAGVERSSKKFDQFLGRVGAAVDKLVDPLNHAGSEFNKFSNRADAALRRVESQFGVTASEISQASSRVESALAKVENDFISLGFKIKNALDSVEVKFQSLLSQIRTFSDGAGNALKSIDRSVIQNSQALQRMQGILGGLVRSVFNLRNAIVGAGLALLGKEVFQAGTQLKAMRQAMDAAAGSSEEGARQFDFAQRTAERLGINLQVATSSYKGILAATVAANREISTGQEIFLGFAEAGRVMQLSNDDLSGSLRAVQQILQKGRVFAEEWNQQLGDRFPVAAGIMARSLNVATEDLGALIQAGEVGIDELLIFARAMRAEFADNISAAALTAAADITRLRNEASLAAEQFGDAGFFSGIQSVANAIREVLKEARNSQAIENLGAAFQGLSEEVARFIKDDGPGMIESLERITLGMRDNLVPAVKATGQTIDQVFASSMVSFATLQRGVSDIAGTFRQFQLSRLEMQRAFANISGTAEDRANLDAAIKRTKQLIDENIRLGLEGDRTREKYSNLLNDMVSGLDEVPGKVKGLKTEQELLNKEVGFTADQVKKFGDNMTVAGGKVQIVGKKSKEAINDDIQKPLTQTTTTVETLEAGIKSLGETAQATGQVSKESIESGVSEPMKKATDGVKDLKEAYETLGEDSLVKFREETARSAEAFKLILDSGKESADRIGELFEDLAEDIIKAHDKIPPEFQDIFDRVEKITGKSFVEITEQVKSVADGYEFLGIESSKELKEMATKSAEAFRLIANDGDESTKRLAQLFPPVAKKIIDAFGEIPPQFRDLFAQMETITGQSFSNVETQSASAASAVSKDMSAAIAAAEQAAAAIKAAREQAALSVAPVPGSDPGSLGATGGGSGRNSRENAAAFDETAKGVDRFAAAFKGSSFAFADTIDGLTRQLQDQRRRLNDPLGSLGAQLAGVPGNIEAFRASTGALVDEIESRLNTLRAQRESERLAAIEAARPEPGTNLSFITGSSQVGGSSGPATSSPSSFGGAGAGGNDSATITIGTGAPDNDPAIDKTADEILSSGNSGALLDPSLIGLTRGGQSRQVILENPQFIVDVKGVDANSIDADGTALALAPAIQEVIRLGEVETNDDSRIKTR